MLDLIAAHRRALADALATLAPDQWRGVSLCSGWTPAHVLAHLTMPFRISAAEFSAGLERCDGDFTRYSDQMAERDSLLPPASLVATLRDNSDNPWAPPGGGLEAALSHDVIHGLDIGWPRALDYDIPGEAMMAVLDSVTRPLKPGPRDVLAAEVSGAADSATLFGFPLDGIAVLATDLPWSAGYGEPLCGSSRDLLPLLAGRQIPRQRFHGAGAARAWALDSR